MYLFPENIYDNGGDEDSRDAIELLSVFSYVPCDLGHQKFKY